SSVRVLFTRTSVRASRMRGSGDSEEYNVCTCKCFPGTNIAARMMYHESTDHQADDRTEPGTPVALCLQHPPHGQPRGHATLRRLPAAERPPGDAVQYSRRGRTPR